MSLETCSIDTDKSTKSFDSKNLSNQIKLLTVNLAFVGIAILIGFSLLLVLRFIGSLSDGIIREVLFVFPVFPLALVGSLIVRFCLEYFNKAYLVSEILQREIGILSTDLLISTAMAGLNLPLLFNDWLALTVLSLVGLSFS